MEFEIVTRSELEPERYVNRIKLNLDFEGKTLAEAAEDSIKR